MQVYHSALMSGRLPDQIDAIRLADDGVRLQGELGFAELVRLDALRAGAEPPPVQVELSFDRSLQGIRYVRGVLTARFTATCQRCLEPVELVVEARPFVEIRSDETAADVMEGADVLKVDGPLRLGAFVEDELLLAMPMIPAHRPGACTAPVEPPDWKKDSGPFAALRGNESAKKRNQGK